MSRASRALAAAVAAVIAATTGTTMADDGFVEVIPPPQRLPTSPTSFGGALGTAGV